MNLTPFLAKRLMARYAPLAAWLLLSGMLAATTAHATTRSPTKGSLDAALNSLQTKSLLPGFCVAIVDETGVRYAEGFGYADISAKRAYTADTIQPIASVSKTLIGVALMQLIEDGLVALDTNVNDVLPFKAVNPRFQSDAITLRQLATHTSSIIDREPFYQSIYFQGDQTAFDLKGFLSAYLDQDGRFYRPGNFNSYRPGTSFEYSNIGATLAAYVVEIKRGVSYAADTRERILGPLHMDSSGWSAAETNRVPAVLYDQHRNVIPPYSFPDYPDGGLFTSCNDLGKFLSEMIKGYNGKSRLLRDTSFRVMFTPQFSKGQPPKNVGPDDEPNEGILWQFSQRGEIGHSGSDPGVDTHMFFNPANGIGRILITNTSSEGARPHVSGELEAIWKTLGAYEGRLVKGGGAKPSSDRK